MQPYAYGMCIGNGMPRAMALVLSRGAGRSHGDQPCSTVTALAYLQLSHELTEPAAAAIAAHRLPHEPERS